jgi:hypothetical protein
LVYVKAGQRWECRTSDLVYVDTYLRTYDQDQVLVAADDDGGGGFASEVGWVGQYNGYYAMRVTNLAQSVGAYDLSCSLTAGPPPTPTEMPTSTANPPTPTPIGPPTPTPTSTLRSLRLGILGPFSGPSARTGDEFRGAVEMAFDAIGWRIGDYAIEPVWIDSQSNPPKASQNYEEAILEDGVEAGLLNWHSSVAVACLEVVVDYQVPHFAGMGATEVVNEIWHLTGHEPRDRGSGAASPRQQDRDGRS